MGETLRNLFGIESHEDLRKQITARDEAIGLLKRQLEAVSEDRDKWERWCKMGWEKEKTLKFDAYIANKRLQEERDDRRNLERLLKSFKEPSDGSKT